MSEEPTDQGRSRPGRIAAIDMARGVALFAMASYHFAWDLEFFGYVAPGLTAFGGWKLYARCIASTFLFLVGVSLVLAHGRGIRWAAFWKRLAMVAVSAAAITLVTFFVTPDSFIFFGILHQIALASLLGLLFLRVPAVLTLLAAALVVAAPHYLRSPAFDQPALWWVGLSSAGPRSNDYVPLLPWFGAVLAGIGAARLALASGLAARLARIPAPRPLRPLVWVGRHSLAFYLVHQPVLIACVWLVSQVAPAPAVSPEQGFLSSCAASCRQSRDAAFCPRYCGCMLDELKDEAMLERLFKGEPDAAFRQRVTELAGTCTVRTDEAIEEEKP